MGLIVSDVMTEACIAVSSVSGDVVTSAHRLRAWLNRGERAANQKAKEPRRRRHHSAAATFLSQPTEPNELWCADYKGEFMLGNRRYCYPLTITDFASRYLLACDALSTTQATVAFSVFERVEPDRVRDTTG